MPWLFIMVERPLAEYYDQRLTQLRASILRPQEESMIWKVEDARRANFAVEGLTPFTNIPQRVSADYTLYVMAEHLRLKLGNRPSLAQCSRQRNRLDHNRTVPSSP